MDNNSMEAVFGTHYNLFAGPQKPQICVARRAEPKREIKLVFHHPNLLFLNPRGERSREEVAKEAELRIVRDIEQRRSWEKLGRYRHSKTELPLRCRTSNEGGQQRKERRLEICGRSSCLKNDQQEEPKTPTVVRTHCSNFAASFCSKSKATDSGVF